MRAFFLLAALLSSAAAQVPATQTAPPAGFTKILQLWPGTAPLQTGTTEADIPKLYTYPAAGSGPHPAVIVMPGGGYTHLAIDKEGSAEAQVAQRPWRHRLRPGLPVVARLPLPRPHA